MDDSELAQQLRRIDRPTEVDRQKMANAVISTRRRRHLRQIVVRCCLGTLSLAAAVYFWVPSYNWLTVADEQSSPRTSVNDHTTAHGWDVTVAGYDREPASEAASSEELTEMLASIEVQQGIVATRRAENLQRRITFYRVVASADLELPSQLKLD